MSNPLFSRSALLRLYRLMNLHYGDLDWWPAKTPWEVIVGAILTQNTAWTNVEKGLANLATAGLLSSPVNIHISKPQAIEKQIKPCGYYRQKALKLKAFTRFLYEKYNGSLVALQKGEKQMLRGELLGVWGIGKETADSILLYALDLPVFVVDAYTTRILERHNFCEEGAGYDDVQKIFIAALKPDVRMFKQFHALFVNVGKDFCKKSKPRCEECPLSGLTTGDRGGKCFT